jgi:7,8-dihydropterin-6-yl-methyl-4-(beta-D-ribofuranosyl)aminobenzene 5'-phosphate synthase
MKIHILTENQSSAIGYLAEWGLSLFIEYNNVKVLFDTGYSDVYLRNSKKMDLNIAASDYVILSHYHRDHTGGIRCMSEWQNLSFIAHPDVMKNVSNNISNLMARHKLLLHKNPFEFYPGAYFLGEIPRTTPFERGDYKGNPMKDDTALAFKTSKGCAVATGCSHSGIANICEYAKEVTGQKLYSVTGGFHLFESDKTAVAGVIEYFKKEQPEKLFPMHCIDMPTMSELYQNFKFSKKSAGDVIELMS